MRWAVLFVPLVGGCFLDRTGSVAFEDAGVGAHDAGGPDAGERDAGLDAEVCVPSVDICDGADNDCDPASPDGSGDPALGAPCDGGDDDLCEDDTVVACTAGELVCSDGVDDVELCNGADDDCDGTIDEGAGCPCRLERFGAHVYLFCDTPETWHAARSACPSGYALTKIETSEEQRFIEGITAMIANADVWIGGTDEGTPGEYRWIADDSAMPLPSGSAYHNWGNLDSAGDCVELDGDQSVGPRWSWNDTPCGETNRYICEAGS